MAKDSISAVMFRRQFTGELEEYGYYVLSDGTLRPQDIVPQYTMFLDSYTGSSEDGLIVPDTALGDECDPWWGTDDCFEAISILEDKLNELCSEGYYFGSNEGNSSCFGFWPIEE